MCKAWMTRTTTLAATLFALSCAAAPPTPPPTETKQPTTVKPTEIKVPTSPLEIKQPISGEVPPIKPETTSSERVALIWGYAACPRRPWLVTVVDLAARAVTTRTMANSSELPPYLPVAPGETCVKGPCPTMSVIMPTPMRLKSGSGTMLPGGGKGLAYVRNSGTTECPEPPMLDDPSLIDMAARLSAAR